jgi:phosphoadenosine phosphosulfate reductase
MQQVSFYIDTLKDKVKKAIERIKIFEQSALSYCNDGYYLAYSGGKDSDVILKLTEMAGVEFKAYYNLTTVDPPELVRRVKRDTRIKISYPGTTMWKLIVKKKMPPTRIVRYCCSELKERGGDGKFVITGVRWQESDKRRKNRSTIELNSYRKYTNKLNDNTEARKMIEKCEMRSKHILNPVIDWSFDDIWNFINEYAIDYCELYDEGFKRLGCIGCPMQGKNVIRGFERYPKYKDMYINAFTKMIKKRIDDGLKTEWETGEEVFNWWVNSDERAKEKKITKLIYENQVSIF